MRVYFLETFEWTCRRCTFGVVTDCNNVGYRGTVVFVDLSAGISSIFYHPSLESTCVLQLIFRIELVGLAGSISVGLYYLFQSLFTALWSINSPCHYTIQFILTRFISLWYLTVLMFGRLNSPGYRYMYLQRLTSIAAALLGNCSPVGFTCMTRVVNFKPLQPQHMVHSLILLQLCLNGYVYGTAKRIIMWNLDVPFVIIVRGQNFSSTSRSALI